MTNAINILRPVTGVTHPLVADMYLKKDHSQASDQDVLVIEALKHDNEEEHYDSFDSYMLDLLMDLEDLKQKAEKKVGRFDRVDIRGFWKRS